MRVAENPTPLCCAAFTTTRTAKWCSDTEGVMGRRMFGHSGAHYDISQIHVCEWQPAEYTPKTSGASVHSILRVLATDSGSYRHRFTAENYPTVRRCRVLIKRFRRGCWLLIMYILKRQNRVRRFARRSQPRFCHDCDGHVDGICKIVARSHLAPRQCCSCRPTRDDQFGPCQ